MRYWLIGSGLLFGGMGFSGCAETAAPSSAEAAVAHSEATPEQQRSDNPSFQDILAEYQAANERLARVAAPLRLSNAALCPMTWRDPGFAIVQLEDYPDQTRNMVKTALNVEADGIYVQSVRPNSSAAAARMTPGDQILAVNENTIKTEPLMESYNRAVFRNGFESVLSKVKIRTPEGTEYVARIRSKTVCDIPSKLLFSEDINGHTDGREVLITSALMRAVPDDTNLALVIAHEMAHVIAGHINQPPTQALELEADRMALVLMARAGYDIETAVAYWKDAAHPHEGGKVSESSHPTTRARYQNFRDELARIRKIDTIEDLEF